MTSRFIKDLEGLKNSLLNELDSFQVDLNQYQDQEHKTLVGNGSEGTESYSQCIQLMQQFESVLNSAIVSVNQEFKPLRIVWERLNTLDKPDQLRIVGNDIYRQGTSDFLYSYDKLLQLLDWFYQFKLSLRACLLKVHEFKYTKIDRYRDEAIEMHSIDLKTSSSTSSLHKHGTTGTTDLASMSKSAMTKSTLLTQTKKLTNKLARSNQMLQSGILQSELNLDELRQQTKTLEVVSDRYSQFQVVFDKTSELVKTLEKASNKEKRDVYLSLGFLVACISWVIWRRILKLPVKMVLWLCFKFFRGILVAIGLVRRSQHSSDTVTGEMSTILVGAASYSPAATTVSAIIDTVIVASTILGSNSTTTTTTATFESLNALVSSVIERALDHDEL